MIVRQRVVDETSRRDAFGQGRLHRRIREKNRPLFVENRHTLSEALNHRFEGCALSRGHGAQSSVC